ncbi:nucleotidyltransferase family protein [Noviherbaspirillum sp.]|uniref:nucleotidyltransferase family protein n=1 Tax=Noviherbaspirillum sp. TaxID=1926288 RepID=UPI002FE2F32F
MVMATTTKTEMLIRADMWRMDCLELVRDVGLPDWMIVAGFVRNLIWDHLHGRDVYTLLNDVDVAFFDPADLSADTEQRIESHLKAVRPAVRWQVRNQARMHLRNGHRPYRSSADAISYYPELPTCIGVRLTGNDAVEVIAPHGMEHCWTGTIRPNSRTGYPISVVRERVTNKRWLEIWPALRMEENNAV